MMSPLVVGCSNRGQGTDAGASASGASGLRVSLPPGWNAEVDPQDALVIGPPGKPVLRIARSSDGDELPSSKSLAKLFSSEMEGARVTTLRTEDQAEGSLWIGRVEATPKSWEVAFGARRVQEEVFLCATLPGAAAQDVRAAAKLCESLGRAQQ